MTDAISLLILAIVQGFSEWFPISSSGHLVLLSGLLGVENSVEMDVALHFGTLMAVFVYFGKDITDILEDMLKGRWGSEKAKLGWMVAVATIPAAFFGFVFKEYFEAAFSSLGLVGIGFAITALLLLIASLDFKSMKGKAYEMGWGKALFVGLMQTVAIFPGISRSGSTIAGGLFSGLSEKEAVRFSFLMSIPAIFGAAILEIGNKPIPREFIWATLVSFIAGMASIHLLLKILVNSRRNLRWFALYCLLLAVGIGVWLLLW